MSEKNNKIALLNQMLAVSKISVLISEEIVKIVESGGEVKISDLLRLSSKVSGVRHELWLEYKTVEE